MMKKIVFVSLFVFVLTGCSRKAIAPISEFASPESEVAQDDGVPGKIHGKLSYPSEMIPEDMVICAENPESARSFCTGDRVMNGEEPTNEYELEVPAGVYQVFAYLPANPSTRAYYSEFVTCGLLATCPSHTPIEVTVKSGEVVNDVDPGDWYVIQETGNTFNN